MTVPTRNTLFRVALNMSESNPTVSRGYTVTSTTSMTSGTMNSLVAYLLSLPFLGIIRDRRTLW